MATDKDLCGAFLDNLLWSVDKNYILWVVDV